MNLFAPAEIAANYAEAGVKKSSLPVSKMLLLGVLAGMLIAFPSCVTNMVSYGLDNNSTIRAISGLMFAFGLGMVILIGAELFTGNTLIFISVLEKKVRVAAMLRDWLFVYIGNFIGSILVAVLCAKFGWLSAGSNALAVYAMKVALGKMTMPFQNAKSKLDRNQMTTMEPAIMVAARTRKCFGLSQRWIIRFLNCGR